MKTAPFFLLLLLLSPLPAFASTPPPQLSAEELRQDLQFLRQTIERTHPDLSHSAEPARLEQALAMLEQSFAGGIARDQAWQRFATLNPAFADAHAFVGFADWRGDSAAHMKAGGLFFPFEVHIDDAGRVFIRAELGGGKSGLAGAQLTRINGMPVGELAQQMLARTHGDTPLFARNLLAQRWWLFHWKMHGAPGSYALEFRSKDGKLRAGRFAGASATPQILAAEASFERQFRLDFKARDVAVLTVASFGGEHKAAFLAFARDAFAQIKRAGSRTLVIDISANGGGDDDLWLEGLMPYLASRPYRTGSTYSKKVLEASVATGELAGQVVRGEITTWHQPQPDNPLRFEGKTYAMIGPATYSSAVLFANALQDFGIATLAGAGGAARSAQSGGVRKFVLPNSGLAVWMPRFVLQRPGGPRGDGLLRPDIVLPREPYAQEARTEALLNGLK